MSFFIFSTKVDSIDQGPDFLPVDSISTPPFCPSSPIIPFSSSSGSAVFPDANTLTEILRDATLADSLPAPLGSVSAPGRPASPVAPAWSPLTPPSDLTIDDVPSWRGLDDEQGVKEARKGKKKAKKVMNDGRKSGAKTGGRRKAKNNGPKSGVFTEKKSRDGQWPAQKRAALAPIDANAMSKRQKSDTA